MDFWFEISSVNSLFEQLPLDFKSFVTVKEVKNAKGWFSIQRLAIFKPTEIRIILGSTSWLVQGQW